MGGESLSWYTPQDNSVFASIDDPPVFTVGAGVPKAQGAHANGTNLEMYVWDRGRHHREVVLSAHHSLAGASRATKLVDAVMFGSTRGLDRGGAGTASARSGCGANASSSSLRRASASASATATATAKRTFLRAGIPIHTWPMNSGTGMVQGGPNMSAHVVSRQSIVDEEQRAAQSFDLRGSAISRVSKRRGSRPNAG